MTPPAPTTAGLSLTVNGEPREFPAGLTVAGLLEELGVPTRGSAVERNRELVPRRQHAETPLQSGDRIEIVTLVGGG
ncbi:sulfur carrier protein ThiS [Alienimonas californiensis]|uniref:Sulfur carrier protein ThiS n=1 Tax=Alienimonas californiensis TaxID=2527989 RepID=A0A517P4M0_9PLAN|nr:sulfur carrier protein ThiS [Alienimonas californiensis]QDT14313.1 Sulfur carrier protein ThiS [Alienimonas californiensis]